MVVFLKHTHIHKHKAPHGTKFKNKIACKQLYLIFRKKYKYYYKVFIFILQFKLFFFFTFQAFLKNMLLEVHQNFFYPSFE